MAEHHHSTLGRLHDAAKNLKDRSFSGAIRSNQTESDSIRKRKLTIREKIHRRPVSFGQAVPSTRISPSAGMPGLAAPVGLLISNLTPTTCLTRSSRK